MGEIMFVSRLSPFISSIFVSTSHLTKICQLKSRKIQELKTALIPGLLTEGRVFAGSN